LIEGAGAGLTYADVAREQSRGGVMLAEIFGVDGFIVVLGLLSLVLVIWAIVDVAGRPTLSGGAKAGWIIGLILGTVLFGVVGLVVALVYLVGVRPRLERSS
jgi:hypothetical protein